MSVSVIFEFPRFCGFAAARFAGRIRMPVRSVMTYLTGSTPHIHGNFTRIHKE